MFEVCRAGLEFSDCYGTTYIQACDLHSAIAGIWITACCLLIVFYIHYKSFGVEFRSLCDIPDSIGKFMNVIVVYFPFTFIFLLNFHILLVARKQRKRILAETTIASIENSTEESGYRLTFVFRFFVALKAAKTFAIVVAVLTFCLIVPTLVRGILKKFCSNTCRQIWYVVFNYELNGINSIVNAFIYGMRHVKCRKAYVQILFKLFSCRKASS